MKETALLFVLAWVALETLNAVFGFDAAYDMGYAMVASMALLISVTFLWLWRERATPLAAGMAFSWLGCAGVVGYWWVFSQLGRPPSPGLEREVLLLFVAFYLGGGVMHLRVISGAHFSGRQVFWTVLVGITAVAAGASIQFG